VPIINQHIPANITAADSLCYEFLNLDKNNKNYTGSHLGSPDDGYWNSSSSAEFLEDMINDRFQYNVLCYGSYPEMQAHENNILVKNNAQTNPLYYNKWTGFGVDDISDLPDNDAMKEMADIILDTGEYGGNEIEFVKFDKKLFKLGKDLTLSLINLRQIRFGTLVSTTVKRIRDNVDEVHGDLSRLGMTLMVVVLRNRLNPITGKKENTAIGGNHTWEGIGTSKHGSHMPILYIDEVDHIDISDTNIDLLGLNLNPRKKQVQTESAFEDIAKQVYNIRVKNPGIKDNKHPEIRKIYKGFNLTPSERMITNVLVNKMIKKDNTTNSNWINYREGKYLKKVQVEKEKHEKDGTTFCKIQSSGKASVGDDLIDIAYKLACGETITRYVLILHHPSEASLENYDKKYRNKNKKALIKLCDTLGIEFVLAEKETMSF